MTKSSLNPNLRRTVEIVQAFGFGVIEDLLIRDGLPCYEPATCVVQSIKLDSAFSRQPDRIEVDLTLKIEFERLFEQLGQIQDGVVDIEFRHGVPFRVAVKRRESDLRALLRGEAR